MFKLNFDVRYANHPEDSRRYDTAELRRHYHISKVFESDCINLTYSHQDRIIAGGIMPVDGDLVLESCKELAAPYFLARRELGAINVGARPQSRQGRARKMLPGVTTASAVKAHSRKRKPSV